MVIIFQLYWTRQILVGRICSTHRTLRNYIDEYYSTEEPFRPANSLLHPHRDFLFSRLWALLQHNIRPRNFLPIDRNTNNSYIRNSWMIYDQSFKFSRGHLIAFDFDKFLVPMSVC